MTTEPTPRSIPYRPLPKIIAPALAERAAPDELRVGDKVNIQIFPKSVADKPFWRLYEVLFIDGEKCRLVTPDKRFNLTETTEAVAELRMFELALAEGDELRRGL